MLSYQIPPLALEDLIAGALIVFTAAGIIGYIVARLHRQNRIGNVMSLVAFFAALGVIAGLTDYFKVSEMLAPYIAPYMGVVAVIAVAANTVLWTLCLYTLFGGKSTTSC